MSSQFWDHIASKSNGLVTSAELEAVAYRLVTEQVLYHSDRHSRVAYGHVVEYEREFRQALSPIGISIEINSTKRYVYAKPLHMKVGSATVPQTLLALVLRAIYDEYARLGQFTDDGEVLCDVVELDERHRLMTKRELPSKGEFSALMRVMKRWGIAKRHDESGVNTSDFDANGSNYTIAIRPAIVDVLGDSALMRLSQWVTSDPLSNETESDKEDNLESEE